MLSRGLALSVDVIVFLAVQLCTSRISSGGMLRSKMREEMERIEVVAEPKLTHWHKVIELSRRLN
jgi:hypothetical protein